jgi:hypothetical protein
MVIYSERSSQDEIRPEIDLFWLESEDVHPQQIFLISSKSTPEALPECTANVCCQSQDEHEPPSTEHEGAMQLIFRI